MNKQNKIHRELTDSCQRKGMLEWGVNETGKGDQDIQTSSYNTNMSWG